jgi:hypothetical protein
MRRRIANHVVLDVVVVSRPPAMEAARVEMAIGAGAESVLYLQRSTADHGLGRGFPAHLLCNNDAGADARRSA